VLLLDHSVLQPDTLWSKPQYFTPDCAHHIDALSALDTCNSGSTRRR